MGTFMQRKHLPDELIADFCPDDVKSFWKAIERLVLQMRTEWDDPTIYTGLESLNKETGKYQKQFKNKGKR
jgi:hypothetical protein